MNKRQVDNTTRTGSNSVYGWLLPESETLDKKQPITVQYLYVISEKADDLDRRCLSKLIKNSNIIIISILPGHKVSETELNMLSYCFLIIQRFGENYK